MRPHHAKLRRDERKELEQLRQAERQGSRVSPEASTTAPKI
jgi:hypothetical protein